VINSLTIPPQDDQEPRSQPCSNRFSVKLGCWYLCGDIWWLKYVEHIIRITSIKYHKISKIVKSSCLLSGVDGLNPSFLMVNTIKKMPGPSCSREGRSSNLVKHGGFFSASKLEDLTMKTLIFGSHDTLELNFSSHERSWAI
jgi:hypothetical protein